MHCDLERMNTFQEPCESCWREGKEHSFEHPYRALECASCEGVGRHGVLHSVLPNRRLREYGFVTEGLWRMECTPLELTCWLCGERVPTRLAGDQGWFHCSCGGDYCDECQHHHGHQDASGSGPQPIQHSPEPAERERSRSRDRSPRADLMEYTDEDSDDQLQRQEAEHREIHQELQAMPDTRAGTTAGELSTEETDAGWRRLLGDQVPEREFEFVVNQLIDQWHRCRKGFEEVQSSYAVHKKAISQVKEAVAHGRGCHTKGSQRVLLKPTYKLGCEICKGGQNSSRTSQ